MHFGPPGVPWLKVSVGFLCTQNWLVGLFVKVEFVDDMSFVGFFFRDGFVDASCIFCFSLVL